MKKRNVLENPTSISGIHSYRDRCWVLVHFSMCVIAQKQADPYDEPSR